MNIGEEVTIELDLEKCDRFGRILGHVWASKGHLNRLMLEEGVAHNYCIFPNIKYCEDFARIVEAHAALMSGVFSDPRLEVAYEWRQRIRNSEPTKYVADQFEKIVLNPPLFRTIHVARRIFFMTISHIRSPFVYVGERIDY